MHEAAQEIKSKIDIVDYVGQLITLQKAGRNYKALCPFHQEKTPSFMVSPDRQNWRCFGSCQEGGDVISFLMKWENCTFYEALQELAKQTGVSLEKFEVQDETYKRKSKLSNINHEAAIAYTYYLKHPKIGLNAREYLNSRDIIDKIIATFSLGFAPPTRRALITHLTKKGYSVGELLEVGLAVKTYSGEIIDRFRNRIMFPIFDPRGTIIGFSGRTLDTSPKEAKYINTPETYLYKKRETLFGIHLTKKNIQDKDCAVIVEGEFDMISCFKSGITNVVAIKGSALTEQQLVLLSRYTKTITLALDADSSGLSTTKRVLPETERHDFKVQIAILEAGKDPDEALKINVVSTKRAIEKPIPVYDFVIEYALKKYNLTDPYQKSALLLEVAPFIAPIENPIVKVHYVNKLSQLLEIDPDTVEKGFIAKKTAQKIPVKKDIDKPNKNLEKEEFIAALLFQSQNCYELFDSLFASSSQNIFTTPAINKLLDSFKAYKEQHQKFDIKVFVNSLPKELTDMFDQLYLTDITDIEPDKLTTRLTKAVLQLRQIRVKSKIRSLLTKDIENNETNIEVQSLTKELSEIEKRLAIM